MLACSVFEFYLSLKRTWSAPEPLFEPNQNRNSWKTINQIHRNKLMKKASIHQNQLMNFEKFIEVLSKKCEMGEYRNNSIIWMGEWDLNANGAKASQDIADSYDGALNAAAVWLFSEDLWRHFPSFSYFGSFHSFAISSIPPLPSLPLHSRPPNLPRRSSRNKCRRKKKGTVHLFFCLLLVLLFYTLINFFMKGRFKVKAKARLAPLVP